jgi:hypothetical protein
MNRLWTRAQRTALALLTSALLALPTLALAQTGPAPVANVAPGAEEASRVVILEAIDTDADPKGTLGLYRDAENLRQIMQQAFAGVPAGRLDRIRLTGPYCTPERLTELVQTLQIGANDSLVVYYSGHGGWHPEHGQYLAMTNGGRVLFRSDLVAAMERRACRLRVLLSDCCSSLPNDEEAARRIARMGGKGGAVPKTTGPVTAGPAVTATQKMKPEWRTVRDLFLKSRGTVDITAAQRGQVAWGGYMAGGAFTLTMVDLLCVPAEQLDANGNGSVEWAEFFTRLRDDAGALTRGTRTSEQTAHGFRLGTR